MEITVLKACDEPIGMTLGLNVCSSSPWAGSNVGRISNECSILLSGSLFILLQLLSQSGHFCGYPVPPILHPTVSYSRFYEGNSIFDDFINHTQEIAENICCSPQVLLDVCHSQACIRV